MTHHMGSLPTPAELFRSAGATTTPTIPCCCCQQRCLSRRERKDDPAKVFQIIMAMDPLLVLWTLPLARWLRLLNYP